MPASPHAGPLFVCGAWTFWRWQLPEGLCEVDFPASPPLPHCSICLFSPSHYPGPCRGSAKRDPAPLIAGRAGGGGLRSPASEAGPPRGEGALPKEPSRPGAPGGPAGAAPAGGDEGHTLNIEQEELLALSLAPGKSRDQEPNSCRCPQTGPPIPQCRPCQVLGTLSTKQMALRPPGLPALPRATAAPSLPCRSQKLRRGRGRGLPLLGTPQP